MNRHNTARTTLQHNSGYQLNIQEILEQNTINDNATIKIKFRSNQILHELNKRYEKSSHNNVRSLFSQLKTEEPNYTLKIGESTDRERERLHELEEDAKSDESVSNDEVQLDKLHLQKSIENTKMGFYEQDMKGIYSEKQDSERDQHRTNYLAFPRNQNIDEMQTYYSHKMRRQLIPSVRVFLAPTDSKMKSLNLSALKDNYQEGQLSPMDYAKKFGHNHRVVSNYIEEKQNNKKKTQLALDEFVSIFDVDNNDSHKVI